MVNSLFLEMYVRMTVVPGATESNMLDLVLPYVKKMKYRAVLVMTTKDHSNIHVLFRFHKATRKDHVTERLVRNVYSRLATTALPPGKKATDYITIGHKMKESDYAGHVAEVLFNDQWGPAPGVETIEDLKARLIALKPYLDEELQIRRRMDELRREERRKTNPDHTHGPIQRGIVDGCPGCLRFRSNNPFLNGSRPMPGRMLDP